MSQDSCEKNFCESIVQCEFDAFVVTVQKKLGLTPGEKLQEVQAELDAARSPWQLWGTHPEPACDSPPILAYSPKLGVQRLDAEFHWDHWHWIIDLRGYRIVADTVGHSHWMPIPPLPDGAKPALWARGLHYGREMMKCVTLMDLLRVQIPWSRDTFGPGMRAEGILKHIKAELDEVRSAPPGSPERLTEWIDIILLALDGAWRNGATPEEIWECICAKAERNRQREWPTCVSEEEPTFHTPPLPTQDVYLEAQ